MEIIDNSWYGEGELVAELGTRKDYEEFCLENGAVGGCAKNKTEIYHANKNRLKEMTRWICNHYKNQLGYKEEIKND